MAEQNGGNPSAVSAPPRAAQLQPGVRRRWPWGSLVRRVASQPMRRAALTLQIGNTDRIGLRFRRRSPSWRDRSKE